MARFLWRARAFLFEQFREQYFERGRAGSLQSAHAQMRVLPSVTMRLDAAGLATLFEEVLVAGLGAVGGGPLSGAAFPTKSATVGFGTTRALGFITRLRG